MTDVNGDKDRQEVKEQESEEEKKELEDYKEDMVDDEDEDEEDEEKGTDEDGDQEDKHEDEEEDEDEDDQDDEDEDDLQDDEDEDDDDDDDDDDSSYTWKTLKMKIGQLAAVKEHQEGQVWVGKIAELLPVKWDKNNPDKYSGGIKLHEYGNSFAVAAYKGQQHSLH